MQPLDCSGEWFDLTPCQLHHGSKRARIHVQTARRSTRDDLGNGSLTAGSGLMSENHVRYSGAMLTYGGSS